jgi:hypothetical protein
VRRGLVFFVLFAISKIGQADGLKADFSAGIVFPDFNLSVSENPASMTGGASKKADLSLYTSQESGLLGGRGAFASKIGSAGWGLIVERSSLNLDTIHAGLGVPVFGSVSLGINYEKGINHSTSEIGAGVRFPVSQAVMGAMYFEDIQNFPGNWTLGLAGDLGQLLKLESDFRFIGSAGSFEPVSVNTELALVYSEEKKVSFKFGVSIPTYPTFQFSMVNPVVGLSFWPSSNFGIFILMNDSPSQYVIGVKFQ